MGLLTSCNSKRLSVNCVGYQAVRTSFARPKTIPKDAKIAVTYFINEEGELTPIVINLSDEILTIDQTKSFFINTDGQSTSYYDPSVKVTSVTDHKSSTKGASVNLGSIAGALGVGGVVGNLLGGVNVGGSNTGGQSTTSSTYLSDLPTVSIGPKGKGAMSKVFKIANVGCSSLNHPGIEYVNISRDNSPYRFSVCISYSFDGGESYDKLVTDFYVGTMLLIPATKETVGDCFKLIFEKKPDALAEPIYFFNVSNNIPESNKYGRLDRYYTYNKGFLIDYK